MSCPGRPAGIMLVGAPECRLCPLQGLSVQDPYVTKDRGVVCPAEHPQVAALDKHGVVVCARRQGQAVLKHCPRLCLRRVAQQVAPEAAPCAQAQHQRSTSWLYCSALCYCASTQLPLAFSARDDQNPVPDDCGCVASAKQQGLDSCARGCVSPVIKNGHQLMCAWRAARCLGIVRSAQHTQQLWLSSGWAMLEVSWASLPHVQPMSKKARLQRACVRRATCAALSLLDVRLIVFRGV